MEEQNNNSQCVKQTYTIQEVATMLGISRGAVYNFCKQTKEFRVMHFGSSIRVHKASFDEWFTQ